MFEDNTGCITLAEHGHFADRSKHIHLRWMFVSDFIRDGILKPHQVPTTQQVADIGTKVLSCDIEHECESRKYDYLLYVGMVVLKTFDDDTRQ
jgi:hypothetical protein